MTKKRSFKSTLARLDDAAWEAEDTEEWEPVVKLATEAIELATTGAELWQFANLKPLDEVTYGDGSHPPEIFEAIFAKNAAWIDPKQRAEAITLAARCTAWDPGRVAMADEADADVRTELAELLEQHIDELRTAHRERDPKLRTAALHALACCSNVDASDAAELAALLDTEKRKAPLATAALCLGKLGRRVELPPAHIESLRKLVKHASGLVRGCAAAALALVSGSLDDDTASALTELVIEPLSLPRPWGWVNYRVRENSVALALRVLEQVDVPATLKTTMLVSLAAYDGPERSTERYEETLFRIAFGPRENLPELGITLEDLDEAQRTALAALSKAEYPGRWFESLGLWLAEDVEPFLEGRGGTWQPVELCVQGTTRRWHLARIWREHIWGDLDAEAVIRAAVEGGIAPVDVVEAVCSRYVDILLAKSPSDPKLEARHLTMAAAVLERIASGGFDLIGWLERFEKKQFLSDDMHALAILRGYVRRGQAPPADLNETIADGLQFDVDHPVVVNLLSSLSEEQRSAILAKAKALREED